MTIMIWLLSALAQRVKRVPYDPGPIHLEIGRWPSERTDLEKAEAISARLSAEIDLAKTGGLLMHR
jgi:hypothetical protein